MTLTQALTAGVYTGLSVFLDAAAFATVVFAPAGLPLDVGIQHALVGFVLMQATVSLLSDGTIIAPVSYEVMPFLGRFARTAAKAMTGAPQSAVLSTILAGSMAISAAAGAALLLLSRLPLSGVVERLLPPALQAGLFSAIGWGLYTTSFETLHLEGLPLDASMLTAETARLWAPAHALGVGLWLASRHTSSPALFPGFVVGVTALTHAVRLATSTSLAQAQASHWLMESTSGRPCTALLSAAYDYGAVRWDVLLGADALRELLSAVLFGPLVNSLLNLLLIGPVVEAAIALPKELAVHGLGALATALGGGYSNYIAVSNTAIHRKCGGKEQRSCLFAAAVALLFFTVHPLFVVVGYVPTLVVAAICVYIGVDFLWDNLVAPGITLEATASWAVLALCLGSDMLTGVVVGVLGFQLAASLGYRAGGAKVATASAGAAREAAGTPAWCLVVKMTLSSEAKVAELKALFEPYALWIQQHEPTTLAYQLCLSDKEPTTVTIYERYADKEKAFLQVHRSSDEFKAFRPRLAALEPVIDGHSYYEGSGFMNRAEGL